MASVSDPSQSAPRSLFNLDLSAAPVLPFEGDVCRRGEAQPHVSAL
jgi:hypothetical protein